MQQIKRVLSCLGAAAISTLAMPAFANTATEQVGTQATTINGDNNQVIQVINQVNVSHPGLGQGRTNHPQRSTAPTTNQATVQDAYQGAAIDGSGNLVYQESNQINVQQRATQPGVRGSQSQSDQSRYHNEDGDRSRRNSNQSNQRRDHDD